MDYKVEQRINLPRDVFNVSPECIIYTVTGSGMSGAGILPDDYVVFDPTIAPENGDIVIVLIGHNRQLVRFLKDEEKVFFRSEGAIFKTAKAKEYEIQGVMVSLIRNGRGKDTFKSTGISWIDPEIGEVE